MDTIIISEEDLKEIERDHYIITKKPRDIIDGRLKEAYDVIKSRKYTTFDMIIGKLGTNRRSARNLLESLKDRGLINKTYAEIPCADGVKRKTALFYEIKKEEPKKKSKKA